jgi:WD40 repeat protein
MAALPQRNQALSAGSDGTVRLWDMASGKQLAAFTGDTHFFSCAITPKGRFAVAGDGAGQVHVLEILLLGQAVAKIPATCYILLISGS